MRLRLKPGVTLDQAISTFDLLATNVHSEATPQGQQIETADRLEAYVDWPIKAYQRT